MVVWGVVRSIVVADRLKSLPSRSMGLAMESPDALVTRQRSGAAENFVSLLNTVIRLDVASHRLDTIIRSNATIGCNDVLI